MGCFPNKPVNKGQSLSPERQRLLKQFQQENPSNSSAFLPINVKSSYLKYTEIPKSRKTLIFSPKKSAAMPMKGKQSPKKRFPLSQERNVDLKIHEDRLVRKQVDGRAVVRKKGAVIELPFRQHLITRVENPSETAQTSLLSNLQRHPSQFFMKFESKLIKNSQTDRLQEHNPIPDVGKKIRSNESHLDEVLIKKR